MARKKNTSTKQRHQTTLSSEQPIYQSYFNWIGAGFVLIFLFVAPFSTALFNGGSLQYEAPIYQAVFWSALTLSIFSIFFFLRWRLESYRDLLSILIWLIPLAYFISSFSAASHHMANIMLLLQIMYASFFVIVLYLNNEYHKWLLYGILGSGYVIAIYGILNLFGYAHFQDAVMLTNMGLRMTSVFQYANTYAAILLAIMFGAVYMITQSKRWYTLLPHAIMLVPLSVSFLLTLSRGALVIIPFMLILVLPFMRMFKQLFYVLYFIIGMAGAFLISDRLNDMGEQVVGAGDRSMVSSGWFSLIAASVLVTLIIWALHEYVLPWVEKKFSRLEKPRLSRLVFPILGIFATGLGALLLLNNRIQNILPEFLRERVASINFNQHSVLERGTFYSDAFKVIGDYPIFGAGGGGWSALYLQYQNNPYTSREAHNFFLQYLIEVGWFGFLALLLILVIIFVPYVRNFFTRPSVYRESSFLYYIFAVTILVHSFIDFNMSYAFISALVFICLGGMAASDHSDEDSKETTFVEKLPTFVKSKYMKISFSAVILLIGIYFTVVSATYMKADSLFKQSISQGSGQFEAILAPLDQAIDLHPDHPTYVLSKVGLLNQVQSQQDGLNYADDIGLLLDELYEKEAHRFELFNQLYLHTWNHRSSEEAISLMDDGAVKFPWMIEFYELAISGHTQLAIGSFHAEEEEKMQEHLAQAEGYYDTILDKMDYLTTLPEEQLQGRMFKVTDRIALSLGQLYYYHQDFESAAKLFEEQLLNPSKSLPTDEENELIYQELKRWYGASLANLEQPEAYHNEDLLDSTNYADLNIEDLLSIHP